MTDQSLYRRYERAFGELEPPFAFVDLDALEANARDMVAMANGKPIRVASKSVRCAEILRRVLALEGFRGVLAFTLPEALWLAREGFEDIVCGYPATDRAAIAELAALTEAEPESAPVLMIDSPEHLDLIEAAAGERAAPIRVAIDVDAGWWAFGGRLKVGPKRSPVRTPEQAKALALEIDRRAGVHLVGLMAYEGQVAGVGDAGASAVRNAAIRAMQSASMREIAPRRAAVVAAVTGVAGPLDFVNGGGTGSLERTAAEEAVTEIAAGSGLYDPVLFDGYRSLELRPAAGFALAVCRRPGRGVATLLGGGYVASGAPGKDRLPEPYLPPGLRLDPLEGAGEVQTPVTGEIADSLRIGDRVYLRHAKAGELCERFDALHLVAGEAVADVAPTYRGEGRTFL